MAIRSVDELASFLTEELKWRTQELDNWKSMIRRCRPHQRTGAIRAGIALLYAHWEGYVKEAARSYLEYVGRKGMSIGELSDELAAVALRNTLGRGEQSKLSSDHTALVAAIRNELQEKARINYDRSMIRTRSNLSFENFSDIMHSVGCDADRHELQRSLINNRLLKNRNDIAHGRDLVIQHEDWLELDTRVVAILRDVRDQLIDAATNQSYRRSAVPTNTRSDNAE
jgi:proline dehydrogenase